MTTIRTILGHLYSKTFLLLLNPLKAPEEMEVGVFMFTLLSWQTPWMR
jgi:hypothetical protein